MERYVTTFRVIFVLQHITKQEGKTKTFDLIIHSLLSNITSKWFEVHDGNNPWEKPAASDAKMER